jgi:DNA-binding GntR family transcriptional regulator
MSVIVSTPTEPNTRARSTSNGAQVTGPIADRAYFGLRDRIVTLRLPPGTSLREDDLMRELGIGRTPLREAIKRLALEHLVDIRPRRGTYVTDVEMADIVHITEVRAELEGQAARLAATRMGNDARAQTEALIAELEGVDSNDGDELLRLDERIHRLVWQASGNPYLAETLEGYFALSLRLWYVVLDRVPGLSATVHDQRKLLEALLARNVGLAGALMRDHVLAFQREVLVALIH